MSGETLYAIYAEYARRCGLDAPTWVTLTAVERDVWIETAWEIS